MGTSLQIFQLDLEYFASLVRANMGLRLLLSYLVGPLQKAGRVNLTEEDALFI